MTPSSTLRDRVLAGVASRPARTRGEGRRRAAIIFAAALLTSASPLAVHGGFDFEQASVAAGGLTIATACAAFALGRGPRLLGHSPRVLVAVAVLGPAMRLVWLERWATGLDAAPLGVCFVRALVSTAPLLAAAWLVKTRSIIDHARAAGAALGATCGAFGAIVVDLSCARGDSWHLALGHVAPVVASTLAGAAAGPWLAIGAAP